MNNKPKLALASPIDVQTMSSREIANVTGKQHSHILRDCDKLNECYEKLGESKIGSSYYTAEQQGSKKYKQYLLTRIQCFDLITGYDTELRIKVNRRWEELEKQQVQTCSSPPSLPHPNHKHCVDWQELVIRCNGIEIRSKGHLPFSYDLPVSCKDPVMSKLIPATTKSTNATFNTFLLLATAFAVSITVGLKRELSFASSNSVCSV